MLSTAHLDQRATVTAQAAVQAAFGEHIRLDYPFTPKRIGRMSRLDGRWRLGTGHTLWRSYRPLDGTWALNPGERFWAGKGPPLDGRWTLGRAPAIPASAETQARISAPITVAPERLLANPASVRVRAVRPWRLGRFALLKASRPRAGIGPERLWRLDGRPLGRPAAAVTARRLLSRAEVPVAAKVGCQRTRQHPIPLSLPAAPTPLGKSRVLNGRWRLEAGQSLKAALFGPALDGWRLGRDRPVATEARALVAMSDAITTAPIRLAAPPTRPRLSTVDPLQISRFALADPERPRAPRPLQRRRLDGWPLGASAGPDVTGRWRQRAETPITMRADGQRTLSRTVALSLPAAPTRLGRSLALDGRWRLGAGVALRPAIRAPRLSGWPLRPSAPIRVDAAFQGRSDIALLGRAPTLGRAYSRRIHRRPRPLDGSWTLKALHRLGQFRLDGRTALKTRKMTQSQVLGQFKLMRNESGRAWPIYDETAVWRDQPVLNGAWRLGAPPIRASAALIITQR